jgi:hypothetical protein
MKKKAVITVVFLVSVGLFWSPGVSGAVDDVTMVIPGEIPRFTATNEPILIGGIIHNVTVAMTQVSDNVTVIMYHGTEKPVNKTVMNYYEWSYLNGTWSDVIYDSYIKTGDCKRVGNDYYFHIGVSAMLDSFWTLLVLDDGVEEWNETVFVEGALQGPPSVSGDSLEIHIEPFTPLQVTATDPHMILRNIQNIPYNISVSFSAYAPFFSVYNTSGIFHPGEVRNIDVGFNAPSWSPQKITVWATVRTSPELMITPQMITLLQAFEIQFPINIWVVRTDYAIIDLGDIVIQYKDILREDFDTDVDTDLLVTGIKRAQLTVDTRDLDLLAMEFQGVTVGSPIDLPLSNTTERRVAVKVHTNVPGVTSYINYSIQSVDGTISHDFYTQINVGPGVIPPPEPIPISLIGIIFLIVTTLIAVVFLLLYSKRQRDKSLYIKRSITRKKGAARRKKRISEEQGDLRAKRKSKTRDSKKNQ